MYGNFCSLHLRGMRQLFSCCLLLLIACQHSEANEAKTFSCHRKPDNDLLNAVRIAETQRLMRKVDSLKTLLPNWLRSQQFNENEVLIADLSIHSGLPRLLLLDIKRNIIADSGLVTHGSGGTNYAEEARFSNEANSYCSSIGKYKIGIRYTGRFGTAFKLHGLEATNNNAYKRAVVLHAHECVPDEGIFPDMICNSLGCPTVSPAFLLRLEKRLRASDKPMLLWIIN